MIALNSNLKNKKCNYEHASASINKVVTYTYVNKGSQVIAIDHKEELSTNEQLQDEVLDLVNDKQTTLFN